MIYQNLSLKKVISVVGLFIIFAVVLVSCERYEISEKNDGNDIIQVETKRLFGKKISECSINSSGFYHGPSKSWNLLNNKIRNEGYFKNGYWHGQWKDYDRDGQLIMLREWDKGELIRVLTPIGNSFKEVPKKEWPKYLNVRQNKPQKINGK